MNVIEAYIAELDQALHGPRRAKADLLAQGRDSLVDAAEILEGGGLDRQAAERQAVEEFGDVREIAPGYQAELALAQGRRTALLVPPRLRCSRPLPRWCGAPWRITGTGHRGLGTTSSPEQWTGTAPAPSASRCWRPSRSGSASATWGPGPR